ncbi:MAG: hypothetical protein JW847_05275 [Candidatus Omnitrophica bacterium]|nr:hypothetical protein [Candidatus Omnitrophota bacterium]
MRKAFLIALLCSAGFCAACVSLAMAAGTSLSEHLPTNKMLEFSLTRLKESVLKIAQKNERLVFENDMLEKSIQGLQRIKAALMMKREELSGWPGDDHFSGETRMTESMDDGKRRERTQELIDIFLRDNKYLEEKVQIQESCLSEQGFLAYRKSLGEKKRQSEKSLRDAEKKLTSIQKRNLGPEKEIEELHRIQNDLMREISEIQSRFRGSLGVY